MTFFSKHSFVYLCVNSSSKQVFIQSPVYIQACMAGSAQRTSDRMESLISLSTALRPFDLPVRFLKGKDPYCRLEVYVFHHACTFLGLSRMETQRSCADW